MEILVFGTIHVQVQSKNLRMKNFKFYWMKIHVKLKKSLQKN